MENTNKNSITYKHITIKEGDRVSFRYKIDNSGGIVLCDELYTNELVLEVQAAGVSDTTDPYASSEWDTSFYLSDGRRFSLERIVDGQLYFEILLPE